MVVLTDDHNNIIGTRPFCPQSTLVEMQHNLLVNEKVGHCNIMREGYPQQ